ncbi:MAG: dihydrolipoyl dehydrogenase [Parvularcula sp.]|jgi:dihydrolipoamide dehydrogenase|nr:dihydrolipoyl dehydrogenase [Parvularcula sp.]
MADENQFDLVVIGGGPAGYAAAIRAGQLGKRVACIELERAGGTCLNWGCIPSKALLRSAELYEAIRHADVMGLKVGKVEADFTKVMSRSRDVADKMAKGIEFLFKKNKVVHIAGRGRISVPGMVEITEGEQRGRFLKAPKILVATGCTARRLPDLELDGKRIMTSREALAMTTMPKSVIILGAGAIGVEFAYFLNAFGSKVRLVEMLPAIVPVEDQEISKTLERSFKKQGIGVSTGTRLDNVELLENGVKVKLSKGDAIEEVEAETLLVAIGVVAQTKGLLSNKVDLKMDRGYIVVDDKYETNIEGIYAAGDVIGPPWLAHVATFEAVQAVNGMFTNDKPRRVTNFPGCTYCQPQIASIGLTEEAAKEKKLNFKVGRFPFTASGKAVAANHPEGFVKVILGDPHGDILGAHIIGADATELITEYALAMSVEATADEIHGTIHAHPTMSEALAEATAAAYDEAIHI